MDTSKAPASSLTPHIQAPKLPFNLTNTPTSGTSDPKKQKKGEEGKKKKAKNHKKPPPREEGGAHFWGGDPVHNARSEGEFKESEDWSLLLLR